MEAPKPLIYQIMSNARSATALKSRSTNAQQEPVIMGSVASKRTSLASRTDFPTTANRHPSSTAEPTPTTRPRSSTPTAGRPILPATTKASRSSTPTSRATLPSSKPAAPTRSSTPTRTAPRSSTPTSRPFVLTSKSSSRSSMPTRQRSDPSKLPSEATSNGRSASVSKASTTILKNTASSRGSSPTLKSRPWKPYEMPGFSLDTPPNLKTTLPERPASASRGRPGNTNSRSSNEAGPNGRPRRQSCSPAKGRASIGNALGNKVSLPIKSTMQTKSSDDVNPVLMGTKMVERVVNMRKLVPPKQDDQQPTLSISIGKSSSLDGSGFGLSLPKKSIDMALRHMDPRRNVNRRPLITNIPASSMYSVRSGGSTKDRTTGASDSPLDTRSNASSEPSVNNNPFFVDGLEFEDKLA